MLSSCEYEELGSAALETNKRDSHPFVGGSATAIFF